VCVTEREIKWVLTSSWALLSTSDIFCTYLSSYKSSMKVSNKFIIERIKFESEDGVSSYNERKIQLLLTSEICYKQYKKTA